MNSSKNLRLGKMTLMDVLVPSPARSRTETPQGQTLPSPELEAREDDPYERPGPKPKPGPAPKPPKGKREPEPFDDHFASQGLDACDLIFTFRECNNLLLYAPRVISKSNR